MQQTFCKTAVFALAKAASERVRELEAQRSVLDRQYPHNRASHHVHEAIAAHLAAVFTPAAIEQLDKLSANEYWFVTLAATALCMMDENPVEPEQVLAGAQIHRDAVASGFLARINTCRFEILEDWELSRAKDMGVVVTDDTWPFEDRDRINPIFCI